MKKKIIQWGLMTVLGLWGMVSFMVLAGEEAPEVCMTLGDFFLIKALAITSFSGCILCDYNKTQRKQKGSPARDNETGQTSIRTYQTERTETEVIMLGDPSYIAEIRKQLEERRKLLGLYAPEKKDINGNVSFASLLIESGLLDEPETQDEAE
nr:MAG: hypothetical protein [Bacteriophage sp.]